jgi:hypothetical protein
MDEVSHWSVLLQNFKSITAIRICRFEVDAGQEPYTAKCLVLAVPFRSICRIVTVR